MSAGVCPAHACLGIGQLIPAVAARVKVNAFPAVRTAWIGIAKTLTNKKDTTTSVLSQTIYDLACFVQPLEIMIATDIVDWVPFH